jgi:Zn finger protein HypA/HybF involved in hydrogenase expression
MKTCDCQSYIEKATKKHGGKYNYKFVEYKNNKTKIKIICPKHGEFFQRASAHLAGQGCIKCRNEKFSVEYLLTQKQFLFKAKEVHGNKYNYKLSVYKSGKNQIKIVCPKHGEFTQQASNHLIGVGCTKCRSEKLSMSQEQFLSKAKEIHGDKYNYNLLIYKNNRTKVKIICKKHGEFLQIPSKHLNANHGCPKCGGTNRLTQNEFVFAAEKKHKNKYNYDLVSYVNGATKVKIICPKHGEFSQRPMQHLRGEGCPRCNMSKGEIKIKEYLDKNGFDYEQQFKFDTCANKRRLPFDFLVRSKEAIGLIEYHGQQHYELVNFSRNKLRAKTKFEKTKHHDNIKGNWCKINSIPLLVISYLEESKMEQILDSFLKKELV